MDESERLSDKYYSWKRKSRIIIVCKKGSSKPISHCKYLALPRDRTRTGLALSPHHSRTHSYNTLIQIIQIMPMFLGVELVLTFFFFLLFFVDFEFFLGPLWGFLFFVFFLYFFEVFFDFFLFFFWFFFI